MVNRTHGGDGIETYNLYVGDVFSLRARKRAEAKPLSVCIVYHFSPLNRNSGIPCFSATNHFWQAVIIKMQNTASKPLSDSFTNGRSYRTELFCFSAKLERNIRKFLFCEICYKIATKYWLYFSTSVADSCPILARARYFLVLLGMLDRP